MDRETEGRLRQIVEPYLRRGRPGDYEHTLRAIDYARQLLQKEKGEQKIVIPTLYLHDIGWSHVDYEDWIDAPPDQKKHADSLAFHMKYGAGLSKQILENLNFERKRIRTIVSIIAIHDVPERVFAMDNPSATAVVEADYLDRYGPESLVRFRAVFGDRAKTEEEMKEARVLLREGLELWFKTKTAKSMALSLAKASGLFS